MNSNSLPERCPVALLIIDVINDFDFAEGDQLVRAATPAASKIHALRENAYRHDIPVIYVNDNFGRWRSDWKAQVEYCGAEGRKGRHITQLLMPGEQDYFVLKPRHSGFYSTTLDVLLEHLGCRTIILTGVATNICVLFTAHDAHMRGYRTIVPADCSAANTEEDHLASILQMERVMKSNTASSDTLDLSKLLLQTEV